MHYSKRILMALAAAMMVAAPALALDLKTARTTGQLGEQRDGYVAVRKASPEATALAAEINAKRQAEYARISAENGQPVAVVGQLAAPQIISNLPAGSPYQDASGNWSVR